MSYNRAQLSQCCVHYSRAYLELKVDSRWQAQKNFESDSASAVPTVEATETVASVKIYTT